MDNPILLYCIIFFKNHLVYHARIQRGGTGSGPLLKNHKNIGFLNNTAPDPQKITKLPSKHSMLGHPRPASEMPFKWHFRWRPNDCPLIVVVFGSSLPSLT